MTSTINKCTASARNLSSVIIVENYYANHVVALIWFLFVPLTLSEGTIALEGPMVFYR